MRNIRFRAWDKPITFANGQQLKGKMVYGEWRREENYLTSNVFGVNLRVCDVNAPLMQFTGLKDKHGKEIYEGDIVRSSKYKNSISTIIWGIYGWCFRTNTPKGTRDYEFCTGSTGQDEWTEKPQLDYYEVIGNIYETPNLLKEPTHDQKS